jgi:hypothetical protein
MSLFHIVLKFSQNITFYDRKIYIALNMIILRQYLFGYGYSTFRFDKFRPAVIV